MKEGAVICRSDVKPALVAARFSAVLFAVSIAIVSLDSGPVRSAIPGQPDAADVMAIDSCLVEAQKAKADLDTCIGRVSSGCQEKAPTLAAREECFTRELLVWDQALSRDSAKLTGLLIDGSLKEALREAERAFAVDKLRQCTFDRIAHRNSPDALLAAARCDVRTTARHDLWLRQEIDSFTSN
jgi:hypothetical protein